MRPARSLLNSSSSPALLSAMNHAQMVSGTSNINPVYLGRLRRMPLGRWMNRPGIGIASLCRLRCQYSDNCGIEDWLALLPKPGRRHANRMQNVAVVDSDS